MSVVVFCTPSIKATSMTAESEGITYQSNMVMYSFLLDEVNYYISVTIRVSRASRGRKPEKVLLYIKFIVS